jgi:hypothetical protein
MKYHGIYRGVERETMELVEKASVRIVPPINTLLATNFNYRHT